MSQTLSILIAGKNTSGPAFDEIEKARKRTEDGFKSLQKTLGEVGGRMRDAGASLTAGVTAPLTALAGGAAKAAISFESAFAGVRKTVEASEGQFKKLNDGFREMAKTIPVSAVELAKIGEVAGQLGIRQDAILGFTKVMAQLGVTTNLTSVQAAESLAQLANNLQMPQDEFDRLGSTLVALGNAGASTEAHIVEMAKRISRVGALVGLTADQVLGLAAALANLGIEAEAGGSSISTVFAKMQFAVVQGGEALRNFAAIAGMSGKQFADTFRNDATVALQHFLAGLKNQGEQAVLVLKELGIEEIRQRDAVIGLTNNMKNYSDSMAIAAKGWRENTALSKEAAERFKTTEQQLKLLWQRIVDVGITLGNALLPTLRDAVKWVESLIPVVDRAAKAFAELEPWAKKVIIALGGTAAVAGPSLWFFGQLVDAANNIIRLFNTLAAIQISSWFFALGNTVPVLTARLWLLEAGLIGVALAAAKILAVGLGSYFATTFIMEVTGAQKAIDGLIDKMTGLTQAEERMRAANRRALDSSKGPSAGARDPQLIERWRQGLVSWKREAFDAFIAQQKEVERLNEIERKALEGHGEQVVAVLRRTHIKTEEERKKEEEAEKRHDKIKKLLYDSQLRAKMELDERLEQEYKKNVVVIRQLLDEAVDDQKRLEDQIEESQKRVIKNGKQFVQSWKDQWEEFQRALDMKDSIAATIGDLGRTIGGVFGEVLESVAGVFQNFIQRVRDGFFDLMEMAQTAMEIYQVGHQTGRRVGSPGKGALAGAAAGAVTGAAVGSMILPGWGTAIGAAAGGIIGGIGGFVGGKKAQKEALQAMEEMRREMLQTFGGMEQLRRTASALGVDISRAFSTKDPQQFQQIVDNLNAAMAEQQKRREGIATALEGLNRMVQGFAAEMDRAGRLTGMAWDEAQKKLEKYKKELEAAGKTEQEIRELMRQRERQLTGGMSEATEEQRAAFQRLGDYAAATFGAMVRETGNVIAALREMTDTMTTLTDLQERFGFEGSAAFQQLQGLFNVVRDNEDLASQIEGLTLMMQGFGQAGIRTTAIFQAFGLDLARIFEEMTGRGVDATTAMILMQPALQALWEHQERFGTITDEATLALLRQGEEAGIVGENMRSVNDKILQVLLAIAKVLGADIPNALRNLPTDRTIRVNVEVNDPNDILGGGPIPPDNSDPNNPIPGSQGFAAHGGRVPWTPGGTIVRAGERVSENIVSDDQLRDLIGRGAAMNGGSFQGGGSPIVVESHITLVLDGAKVGKAFERRVVAGHHPGLRGR